MCEPRFRPEADEDRQCLGAALAMCDPRFRLPCPDASTRELVCTLERNDAVACAWEWKTRADALAVLSLMLAATVVILAALLWIAP